MRRALEWDVFVPDDQITSTVADGWITLDGTVERAGQSAAAERAVRNLAGVKAVVNNIAVKTQHPGSSTIHRAIDQALERRAEREAKRIRVDVRDGTVILTGAVHTWADRKAVVAAARFTPGVRAVEDRLVTEPI